jgi:hypothetical protein
MDGSVENMFEQCEPSELVELISASRPEEGALIARRVAAVAELPGRRTAEAEAESPDCGYMIITGLQRTRFPHPQRGRTARCPLPAIMRSTPARNATATATPC